MQGRAYSNEKSDKQAEANFEVLVNPRVGLIDYLFSGGGPDSCVLHGASCPFGKAA
jgi:hypothetical protein